MPTLITMSFKNEEAFCRIFSSWNYKKNNAQLIFPATGYWRSP